MTLFSFITILIYLILIGSFAYGFKKVPVFTFENKSPETKFSVIIPFRNEALNLPALLNSVTELKYPNDAFEIILIDDESEDNSIEIIENFRKNTALNIKLFKSERQSGSPKKDAITLAMSHAAYEWIITTDADCILPEHWLNTFDAFILKTNSECVVGPVNYIAQNNFLNTFQRLDFLSLQGVTIGAFGIKSPLLCNGANLAYKKTLFNRLDGFNGNLDTASGDDIFFLEKALKHDAKKVNYLKNEDAIVLTNTQYSWQNLINQRIRWAAKTSAYKNGFSKFTGFVVIVTNMLLLVSLLFALTGITSSKTLTYLLLIKFSIDLYLINLTAEFFKDKSVMKFYVFGFLVYPFFCVYVGIASIFTSYNWKGRRFKK
ncbi:glycosyltransferase family 2 protein [Aestuariibaculum sediminum]|uniref:Glycosyltransferase n=1 Tax=Aestuariibaculum sediminum TaxID=2770637 RepID=A0A8J6U6M4_9FLAO|nr:glycosyltransferase [Aestuariibaculum sediminum]MBD0830880.1 glycosyltransferase [Aestuariibaculum sediminum]